MSLFRSIWRGQGGGSTGGGSASDITFNPAGLKVLKGTNVQSALNETDNALADLQDSVSILATSVPLANTIGADTVIMLDELTALEIDGRPNYKLPGATVFAPNGQQGIIHSVDSDNQSATVKTTVLSAVSGGGTNAGIKGDYFATWGWTEGDNGLPTIAKGSNNIKTPTGIVMTCPGADGYITFTGEMVYENELTEDFTLFYARNTDGTGATLVGVTDVVWSDTEPEPNGQSGFQAWKKSGSSTWQLRSNDTGNTWREVVGGPLGDVHYTDGTVTRLDFDGYRQFNKQQYVKFASGVGATLQSWIPVMTATKSDHTKYSIESERLIIDNALGKIWGSNERSFCSMGAVATAFKTPLSHTNSNTNLGCSMADLSEAITPIQDHSVIEFQAPTADNNYTWYRKYKDGWVEQGGNIEFTSDPQSISFPVEMTDANYTATAISNASSASGWAQITSKTTTGLSVGMYYGNGTNSVTGGERNISWQVLGMYKRD